MNSHQRRVYRRQQARVTAAAVLAFIRRNARVLVNIIACIKERIAKAPKTAATMLAKAVSKLPVKAEVATYAYSSVTGRSIPKIRRLG